jgi:ADP-ribose pyrophosphatase
MKDSRKQNSKKLVLHEGKFIRFINKNGWEYFERNNCTGIVIIVAKTDEDKVIFVEQYRAPVDKSVIEFPAGLVNDGEGSGSESLESAAIRELFEETGFQAASIEKWLIGPVSAGASSDLVTMVRAHNVKRAGDGGGDPTENIKVHEILLAKAEEWLKKKEAEGFLIEPKVYAGLYFLNREA